MALVPCDTNCDWSYLLILANNLINFLIEFATILAAVAFAYAGFLFLTAGGDSGKISKAWGVFRNVAIGFIFVLGAWLLVFTLLKVLDAKVGVEILQKP